MIPFRTMFYSAILTNALSVTQVFNFASDDHGHNRFDIDANLAPETHDLCANTNSFDFFVPSGSRASKAWVKIKEDEIAVKSRKFFQIRLTLYASSGTEVASYLINIRNSHRAQPVIIPIDWEFLDPWRINFKLEPNGFHDHSCILKIDVKHCNLSTGTRNSDPVVPSATVVGQISAGRRWAQSL